MSQHRQKPSKPSSAHPPQSKQQSPASGQPRGELARLRCAHGHAVLGREARGCIGVDRFSREGVSATLNHLERLTAAGVNWRSFTEEYLDSCGIFRDAVLSILATIARQERVRRSERASAAIAKLRRQGRSEHLGRPRLVLDRSRARKLRERGWSVRQIAAKMGISPATAFRITK